VLATAAARRLRVPSVVTFDSGELVALADIDYGLQRRWRSRTMVRLASRWATRVHVGSEYMAGLARAARVPAACIPMGVDLGAVPYRLERGGGPPWRLLQVASLNRVKDQTTLLEAVVIATASIDLRLDVIGEDTLNGAIQRLARQLNIADRVAFHGFLPHDETASFRSRAHLYVQSSRHEGAPVVILEAAAAGLPVVGTRVGYVADWAPGLATAVSVGDARGLADAIVALIRDPERRQAQAVAAHRFAAAHDADWTAAALEALYEDARSTAQARS
jgi:glycosyltransferase involved in cell wall biosynthesis